MGPRSAAGCLGPSSWILGSCGSFIGPIPMRLAGRLGAPVEGGVLLRPGIPRLHLVLTSLLLLQRTLSRARLPERDARSSVSEHIRGMPPVSNPQSPPRPRALERHRFTIISSPTLYKPAPAANSSPDLSRIICGKYSRVSHYCVAVRTPWLCVTFSRAIFDTSLLFLSLPPDGEPRCRSLAYCPLEEIPLLIIFFVFTWTYHPLVVIFRYCFIAE